MEEIKAIVQVIEAFVTFPAIAVVIVLALVNKIFKNRYKSTEALNLYGYSILVVVALGILIFLVEKILNLDESLYDNRMAGPYWLGFWAILIGTRVLPLTLIYVKLRRSFVWVFFVAIGLNFGLSYERFIILITSLHRDHSLRNDSMKIFVDELVMVCSKGFVLAVFLMLVVNIFVKRK